MGNAAFLTASFAIIAKEFPDNVATTFASLETFFGLGLIVGPTVGGALYQVIPDEPAQKFLRISEFLIFSTNVLYIYSYIRVLIASDNIV